MIGCFQFGDMRNASPLVESPVLGLVECENEIDCITLMGTFSSFCVWGGEGGGVVGEEFCDPILFR